MQLSLNIKHQIVQNVHQTRLFVCYCEGQISSQNFKQTDGHHLSRFAAGLLDCLIKSVCVCKGGHQILDQGLNCLCFVREWKMDSLRMWFGFVCFLLDIPPPSPTCVSANHRAGALFEVYFCAKTLQKVQPTPLPSAIFLVHCGNKVFIEILGESAMKFWNADICVKWANCCKCQFSGAKCRPTDLFLFLFVLSKFCRKAVKK